MLLNHPFGFKYRALEAARNQRPSNSDCFTNATKINEIAEIIGRYDVISLSIGAFMVGL